MVSYLVIPRFIFGFNSFTFPWYYKNLGRVDKPRVGLIESFIERLEVSAFLMFIDWFNNSLYLSHGRMSSSIIKCENNL